MSAAAGVPRDVTAPRHLITIALEDYYHVGAFNRLVQRGEWYRFESRLEVGTRRTLELLDAHGVKATFFALGWVADQVPELVREIADRGHEVASKGYYHRHITHMTPEEFVDDLARARDALQRASGRRVLGYRVAGDWLRPEDLWVLDALVGEGYLYDSSIAPAGRTHEREPFRRFAHRHETGKGSIWEFPISSTRLLGLTIPIAGGNYFRQLPTALVRAAAARWLRAAGAPFVMYFHTWELDAAQPRITAASWLQRVRHYRNLRHMEDRVEWFLKRWRFTSVASYLDHEPPLIAPRAAAVVPVARPVELPSSGNGAPRLPVTIVVPCYNEELILPYLSNTLRSVEERLGGRYALQFVFVNDGSSDGTARSLHQLFGARANCRVAHMPVNTGVAAAILHGISVAETEVVCSIDCDCTYDPHRLEEMIPRLEEGVAMVTASPYHALGAVRNVAAWRLFLSQSVSRMYRLVMHNKLATYTSCFRVYRRSAVDGMVLDRQGFLGVTEILGRLDLAGHRITEFPATLEVRIMGTSKLRVMRAIGGHLSLLGKLAWLRLTHAGGHG